MDDEIGVTIVRTGDSVPEIDSKEFNDAMDIFCKSMWGKHPTHQATLLCEMLATHLAGHPDFARPAVLRAIVEALPDRTIVNEFRIFEGRPHPNNKGLPDAGLGGGLPQ